MTLCKQDFPIDQGVAFSFVLRSIYLFQLVQEIDRQQNSRLRQKAREEKKKNKRLVRVDLPYYSMESDLQTS